MIKRVLGNGTINIIGALLSLVTIPLLISRLGLDGYGHVALVLTVCTTFLIFTDFGLSVVAPGYLRGRGANEGYLGALPLIIAHAIVGLACLVLGLLYLASVDPSAIKMGVLGLVCCLISNLYPAYLAYFSSMDFYYTLGNLIIKSSVLLSALIYVHDKNDASLLFVAQLVSTIFVYSVIINKAMKKQRASFRAQFNYYELLGEAFGLLHSAYVYFSKRIILIPVGLVPVYIMTKMGAMGEVSLLSIADKMKATAWQFFQPIVYTMTLQAMKGTKGAGESMAFEVLFNRILLFMFLGFMVGVTVLIGVLKFFFQHIYAEFGFWYILLGCFCVFTNFLLSGRFVSGQQIYRRNDFGLVMFCIAVMPSIGVAAFGAYHYGAMGAIVGYISQDLLLGVSLWIWQKYYSKCNESASS